MDGVCHMQIRKKGDTMVDLHTHTCKSDGSLTPTELLDHAKEVGLNAIAITDHDTVDGIEEAMTYAKTIGIRFIPGIEISAEREGHDIHIVGLFIDHTNSEFKETLQGFMESRDRRNEKMCAMLREGEGMDISVPQLMEMFPDCVLTRAHYARYMLEKGYIKSVYEAFERFIGDGKPYFITREKVECKKAIELILMAGGVPILAHPYLYHLSDRRIEELIVELKGYGLAGIEAYYTTHSAAETRQVVEWAKKYGLLVSGGSDFHGAAKPRTQLGKGFGDLYVDDSVLERIEAYHAGAITI